ncbi:bicaudal C homolog 2 [Aplochiton taeniatus]
MANAAEECSPFRVQTGPDQPDLEPRTQSPGPDSDAGFEPSQTQTQAPLPAPCDKEEEEEREEEVDGVRSEAGSGSTRGGEHSDPEWVEERFRIDRKKLETMLYAPKNGDGVTGEEFFERVMRETDTQVKWPSKLKIGAKSKKDPHVKVEGKRADVLRAKKRILEVLETKVNKVTLKMDVAHTEHSHVIGKGGGNIKKVMEATSCHVHFPDSNRHSATGEKSNQVSIAGPIQGVEEARRRIRDLQPLALTFDLPASVGPQGLADAVSPVIQQVAQSLGVSVSFRAQPPLYSSCCVVRGLQGNAAVVKKAVSILTELLLGSPSVGGGPRGVTPPPPGVSSQLDVTAQQHLFLLGQNGAHFLGVMRQTQTQIVLPDLSAPQSPPSLLIQGSPDGVCLARQQLMDCLPVCLMFDMREDSEVDAHTLAQMMQSLGVFISVKPKVKQTAKSVVVKGLERNIASLYEARRLLLGLEACEVTMAAKINSDPVLAGNELTNYWLNMLLQQLRLSDQASAPSPEVVIGSHCLAKPRPTPPPGLAPPTEDSRMGMKGIDSRPLEKILEYEDQGSQSEDEGPGPLLYPEGYEAQGSGRVLGPLLGRRRASLQGPEVTRLLCQGRRHSTGQAVTFRLLGGDAEAGRGERRSSLRIREGPPRAHHLLHTDVSMAEDHDYEKKKLLASRAMQREPVVTQVQTPTDTWSGLGFSKSMPAEAIKELRNISRRSYKPYLASSSSQQNFTSSFPALSSNLTRGWNDKTAESFLGGASYFEARRASTCSQRSSSPQPIDDLPVLLSQLGLEKYSDVFQEQEIDFQTFLTLSEEDLKEVGISTFGARRKMLLAITDLKKSTRRLSDTPTVRPGYLEGGASGRLPRIADPLDAAQSNRW